MSEILDKSNNCLAMLPEPDLFSSVPNNNTDSSLYNQSTSSGMAAEYANSSIPNKTCASEVECLTDVCKSNSGELSKHHYTVGVRGVLRSNLHIKSKDPHEKLSRHWYLTVIILLYVGLITPFCLNVNAEHSTRAINLEPYQFGSYAAEPFRSKYI